MAVKLGWSSTRTAWLPSGDILNAAKAKLVEMTDHELDVIGFGRGDIRGASALPGKQNAIEHR